MIKQQLALVLSVRKTRRAYNEIRQACNSNMLNLCATLTKVSILEIYGLKKPQATVNFLLPRRQYFQ